jgi:hypothetical protein
MKANNQFFQGGMAYASIALLLVSFAHGSAFAAAVTRGPYLQMATPNSIVVRWRTDTATNSRVQFGTSQTQLTSTVNDTAVGTEHVVKLTGLNAETQYYYNVGSSTTVLTGGDANTYFKTGPVTGSVRPSRIWVIGDAGTGTSSQTAVYNAYLNHTGSTYTNLWLMLGDNVYDSGTDAEFQAKMFNMYPALMRKTVFWSTLGNHDAVSADSATQSGPYYDIHTFPKNAEAGGVASGTEAYYSFNYANIHFIVLDSQETSRSSTGAMMNWMKSDLQSTTADWVIAFWHHPPYSKGSHDSDTDANMKEMRQVFLPVLESYGVDLVLSGHSHSYERSKFLNGHYGTSGTLTSANIIDGNSGRVDVSGAYTKTAVGVDNAGVVYSVVGASGKISGGSLNHPAMYLSLNELGSMVLDVDGLTLNAKYIGSTGTVRDYFTITKGTSNTPPPTIPTAPSNLVATALTYNSIRTNWTDTAGDETGFELERSQDSINWTRVATPGANVVTYTDSSLVGSTTYYYRVRAVNAAGGSAYSNVVNATTPAGTAPITKNMREGENSYTGNIDSHVSSTKSTTNYGTATTLLADGSDTTYGRVMSVFRWDVSSIPSTASVDSVKLTLQVVNKSAGTYKLFPLNAGWSEASVTYSSLNPLSNIGAEIGSFIPSATGSKQITLNAAGIALVKGWINGSVANNGFIIIDASTDGLDMSSSEHATISQRPMLSVTYQ